MKEYYSWKDIYYEAYPHLKPDKTFSDRDIIRFYENNLTFREMEMVRLYFKEMDEELDPHQPDYDPLPDLPVLPPPETLTPLIPLLPAVPPAPPALPPQALPPPATGPEWLSPTFPFIIFQLLPPDILDWIKEMVGLNDVVEAAELTIGEMQSKIDNLSTINRYHEDLYKYWRETAQVLESWQKYGPPPWLDYPGKPTVEEWEPSPDEDPEPIDPLPPTQFPDWWEEFEDEEDLEEDVTSTTWVGGGFSHGEIIRAIEWLLEGDIYGDIQYLGWYKDTNGNIWYILREAGEDFEYTGEEVMEVARSYGYPY